MRWLWIMTDKDIEHSLSHYPSRLTLTFTKVRDSLSEFSGARGNTSAWARGWRWHPLPQILVAGSILAKKRRQQALYRPMWDSRLMFGICLSCAASWCLQQQTTAAVEAKSQSFRGSGEQLPVSWLLNSVFLQIHQNNSSCCSRLLFPPHSQPNRRAWGSTTLWSCSQWSYPYVAHPASLFSPCFISSSPIMLYTLSSGPQLCLSFWVSISFSIFPLGHTLTLRLDWHQPACFLFSDLCHTSPSFCFLLTQNSHSQVCV